jgi:hypothetical protein
VNRQRLQLNGATDLWQSPIRGTRDDDRLDDLIAATAAEFETAGEPVDERSGLICHLKAATVAAAASGGGPVDEAGYLRALNAVADESGRRYADDDVIAVHCDRASALADLAAERLRQRGIKRDDEHYADLYVCEVEQVGREFGLPYRARR